MALAPPPALVSPESIVLDGANGVTPAPRGHFPDAAWMLGGALVVVVLVRVLGRARPGLVWGLLGLAAVPGLVHVLALRADAPLHRPVLASVVRQRVEELKGVAPWPGGTQVVREADEVLFPVGRYVLPSRLDTDGGVRLELGAGPLIGARCVQRGDRVLCGEAP